MGAFNFLMHYIVPETNGGHFDPIYVKYMAWQHSVNRLQTLWHESGHENDCLQCLADFFGSSVMMCKFAEDFSEQGLLLFSRRYNCLDSASL